MNFDIPSTSKHLYSTSPHPENRTGDHNANPYSNSAQKTGDYPHYSGEEFMTPYINPSLIDVYARDPVDQLFRDNSSPEIQQLIAEKYPSWFYGASNASNYGDADKEVISLMKIKHIFTSIQKRFGFQRDNVLNIFDLFMTYLDSRASRMNKQQALRYLHADFIGGENANYRKWYFACQLDIHDEVGFSCVDDHGILTPEFKQHLEQADGGTAANSYNYDPETAFKRWRKQMSQLSDESRVAQVALYLLCWGEANHLRFMPEFLAFIFKCLYDNYTDEENQQIEVQEGEFLNSLITPIYNYYKDQMYEEVNGVSVYREKDHKDTVGYDDMNQLFWYRQGLLRLKTYDGSLLLDKPKHERYFLLKDIDWSKAFYKSYRERRTWLHVFVNFNRIWIIHLGMFWFYTAFNSSALYTVDYEYTINNEPPLHVWCTIVALGGAIGPLINILCLCFERMLFVPGQWPGSHRIWTKLCVLLFILALNIGPTVWILGFVSNVHKNTTANVIAILQLFFSILSWAYLSVDPLFNVKPFYGFSTKKAKRDRKMLANRFFTSFFPKMSESDRLISFSLWFCVYVAKFSESYFLLTLSVRDPIRELSIMETSCTYDSGISSVLCQLQPLLLLVVILFTDLVLFFLDTYLWYIIFNSIFSVVRLFYLRGSIWTPWRDIYSQLTQRLFYKLLNTGNAVPLESRSLMTARVWNPIIYSMYRDHLIPREVLPKLLFLPDSVPESQYNGTNRSASGSSIPGMLDPCFCGSPDDQIFPNAAFDVQSEAERRISFFAQSLAIPLPNIVSVNSMPAFTVLVPHYTEKIMLSVREIIRVTDSHSQISLLEYLKRLKPMEWKCFVRFVVSMDNVSEPSSPSVPMISSDKAPENADNEHISVPHDPRKYNELDDTSGANADNPKDLPMYCIGFKNSSPMEQLQTRIWASLRTQTLLRTIYGFMKYSDAIDILEQAELGSYGDYPGTGAANAFSQQPLSTRKFRLIIAAQRLIHFTDQEMRDIDFILRAFPTIQVAYVDEEATLEGKTVYYSALIDGDCPLLNDGSRKPKYRIRLSGDPILGDGKSDNQNCSLVFHRGEYIQLVDANQDNYLEECLKIRNVLAEFEEMGPFPSTNRDPYGSCKDPVAIVGAREYIFSENVGVLGDIAAGKEQTFGTLFARTLAKIGGKLHYGHPDFLNGIFMLTRGGVSKGQRGLHLNEDIYAGMNALVRGGRIKHSEYIQCGKGRDLGFSSISNFTTKIGTGMGEQMLSREYYYLGAQLSIDRFLSFYYAHPGFHINNLSIIVSLELLILVLVNLAMMFKRAPIICKYNRNAPTTDPHEPAGCQNLIPLLEWVQRCVLSVMVVFFISFLPLFVQELTERGIWKSLTRLAKHLGSFSPLFEIFICQIYAKSLIYDFSYGGAKYISTGRGFATERLPFTVLYRRFALQSIYFGARSSIVLLIVSSTIWRAALLWFWLTTIALVLAPFFFNPHQFCATEFLLDYRLFFRWFGRGNRKWHEDSWIGYIKENRAKITGYKRKSKADVAAQDRSKGIVRPGFWNAFFCDVGGSLCILLITLLATGPGIIPTDDMESDVYTSPFITLLIISMGPIVVNMAILLMTLAVSLIIGPLLSCIPRQNKRGDEDISAAAVIPKAGKFSSTLAQVTHVIGIIVHFAFYYLAWVCAAWDFQTSLTMFLSALLFQSLVFKFVTVVVLTREPKHERVNRAWWAGNWFNLNLEWSLLTQPFREFLCKVIEMSLFTRDFILGHCIFFLQLPLLLVPYMDRWHSMTLFWLVPSRQLRPPVFLRAESVQRRRAITVYSFVLISMLCLIIGLIILPCILPDVMKVMISDLLLPYLEIPYSLLT